MCCIGCPERPVDRPMPQGSAYATHEIDEHLIRSRVVAETFRIRVRLPISRLDGSERFPVLYLTDADELFAALATLATALEFTGEIPRIVLVGVGYENFRAAEILRMRDLVPAAVRRLYRTAIARTARSPLARG